MRLVAILSARPPMGAPPLTEVTVRVRITTMVGARLLRSQHRPLATAAILVLLASSCGSAEDGRTTTAQQSERRSLDGLKVSGLQETSLLVARGEATAVVDGAALIDDAPRLAVWVQERDGDVVARVVDGDRPPMVYPRAWWQDSTLTVFGLECPEFDRARVRERIDYGEPEEVCGEGAKWSARRLDTGGDREVVDVPISFQQVPGVSVDALSGDLAYLGVRGGGSSLVDLGSGRVVPLEFLGQRLSSVSVVCPQESGTFLIVNRRPSPNGESGDEAKTYRAWRVTLESTTELTVERATGPDVTVELLRCLPDGPGVWGQRLPDPTATSPTVEPIITLTADGEVLRWGSITGPSQAATPQDETTVGLSYLADLAGSIVAQRSEVVANDVASSRWARDDDGTWDPVPAPADQEPLESIYRAPGVVLYLERTATADIGGAVVRNVS